MAPTLPEIQDNAGTAMDTITVLEGQEQKLHCMSRHGSPAAYLRWTLNKEDISTNATFYNESELLGPSGSYGGGSPDVTGNGAFRMYTAGSWLTLTVNRSLDNAKLVCSSKHLAFSNGDVKSTSVLLNIICKH